MKKLYSVGMIISMAFLSNVALADYCDSRMGNLSFYAVKIGAKSVTCHYRYCYYGCIYDSYAISGRFKPGYGPWTKDDDGLSICYDSNSSCEFLYKLNINPTPIRDESNSS